MDNNNANLTKSLIFYLPSRKVESLKSPYELNKQAFIHHIKEPQIWDHHVEYPLKVIVIDWRMP